MLLATGLRMASADPGFDRLGQLLDAVLPMEHLWYRHLMAGAGLIAVLVAYAVYLLHARLQRRLRLDWGRIALLLQAGRPRWATASVITVWALLAALGAEIVTGVALFLGAGDLWLSVHLHATWVLMVLAITHVLGHWIYGGWSQLSRILRPAPLVLSPPPPDLADLLAEQLALREREARGGRAAAGTPVRAHGTSVTEPGRERRHPGRPLASIIAAATVVLALAAKVEQSTRVTLHVKSISRALAPRLDGDLSDPAWSHAPVASVLTQHGSNFGGTGSSVVDIRAVHDDEFAYFAFVWTDPTRSLKHLPLVKRQDGWYLAQTRHDVADENELHEDKLAILLAQSTLQIIGAAIHLSPAPLPGKPPSLTGRGLHYMTDGSIADVWQWRASHGGSSGHIDNCHFGGPAEATEEQTEGRERYTGGFAQDPGSPAYQDNFRSEPPGGYQGPVEPRRLPIEPGAMMRSMGRIQNDAEQSESEGARWWMTEDESVPYSKAADDVIETGTVIPGVIMIRGVREDAASVRGVARWAAGRWVLELARRLRTGSKWDVPIASGVLMWLAAFDHSETRHTWHVRPVQLEVE
ncbi:MAG: hypothetical protein J2P50_08540 [Hyphomicrobiaceae bacterium]|nr:hypothetical protein [Hyphomicrobiaceae bacterium]